MRAPVVPIVPKMEMIPPRTYRVLRTIWRVSLLNFICAIRIIQKMIVSLRIVPVLIFWMRPFSVWISMMFLIIPTEFCIISKKFFLAWTKLGLFLKIPTLYYFFGFIRAYLSGTIWLSSPSSFQRTISADSELHLRITGISFLSD